jgi:hypothetical protein
LAWYEGKLEIWMGRRLRFVGRSALTRDRSRRI